MNNLPNINPAAEKSKIAYFIKNVLKKEGFKNVIIAMSGGVDSATSFYLLKEVVPPQNIFVTHLYYFNSQFKDIEGSLKEAKIPKENIYEMSIKPFVEIFTSEVQKRTHPRGVPRAGRQTSQPRLTAAQHHLGGGRLDPPDGGGSHDSSEVNRIRLGNIMARIRMIVLYDLAKKHNALVCGTENKSEYLLGYFTRFGDQASDFEPMQHLYKTQVYELAKFLGVPKHIIDKTPTAGLWTDQTDEGEFGFTYKEADKVLCYYYDKKLKLEEIKKKGFPNAERIIKFSLKNAYKHHAPYTLTHKDQ